MRRLLDADGSPMDTIVAVVGAGAGAGAGPSGSLRVEDLERVLTGDHVPDDADLMEELVRHLGGRWIDDGYRALYEAVLHEQRRPPAQHGHPVREVSGLPGADPTDPDTVMSAVAPPVYDEPVHGRADLITRLTAAGASPGGPVRVLLGESGHGKTTVARAVTDELCALGIRTLWASAHDHDELAEGLRRAAMALGASVRTVAAALRADPIERVDRLWRLLDAASQPWVLVLDDAGADLAGAPYWSRRSPNGTVIVTSRTGPVDWWGPDVAIDRIGPLEAADGARLVLDRVFGVGVHVGDHRVQQARALSERLGGVPLALVSAADAATRGGEVRLEQIVAALDPAQTGSDAQGPVATAFGACIDAIPAAHRDAARSMLRRAAWFAVDEPLPVSLLADLPSGVLDELVEVGLLREATPAGGQRCVNLHPAVADLARPGGDADPAGAFAAATAALQRTVNALDSGLPAHWPMLLVLQPHVEALTAAVQLNAEDRPGGRTVRAAVLRAAALVATGLMRADSYPSAMDLLDRALSATDRLDGDDPVLLDALQTRAWMAATANGDLAGAEAQVRRIVTAKVRVLGRRHPETLSARDCLAWLLAEQRLLGPALHRFTGVLVDRTEVLGPRHRDTLATRHRVAWVLALRGQDAEAADELRRVVQLRTEVLGGTDHLEVHTSRYRLAWLLARTDHCDEALEIFEDLSGVLRRTVGPTHPMSLMVRSRLGWVATRQMRFSVAQRIYLDLVRDQRAVLGPDHPRTLRTRYLLGKLLLKQGHTAKAADALR
ncbi:tetratricopeptide repeat protein, partial [Pseudonocardia sp.]